MEDAYPDGERINPPTARPRDPAGSAEVERLVAAERECCPFLGLELTIRDDSVSLVTAFPGGLSPNDWEW